MLAVLSDRGYQHVSAPRHAEYDLTDADQVAACIARHSAQVLIHLAAVVGGIGANRARPGRVLLSEPHHGRRADGAGAAGGRRRSSSRSAPSAPTPSSPRCRSAKTTCGTATPRRPTRPTAWPRRCCWSRRRPTASSTASTASTCCRPTCTARATTSTRRRSHVIPALIRKCVEAVDNGDRRASACGAPGQPTREFLYVRDCAEGIVAALERYDGSEPVNLGSGEEIRIGDLARLIAEATGFQRRDPLRSVATGRPAAPQSSTRLAGACSVRLALDDNFPRRACGPQSTGTAVSRPPQAAMYTPATP